MELNLYEITIVLDHQMEQKQIDEYVKKIESLITGSGGKIVKKDYWGKRRLAYEINRKQYGFYVYILFKSESKTIQSMERDLKLNESVLRFLTIRLSKSEIKQLQKDFENTGEKADAQQIMEDHNPEREKEVPEENVTE